MKTVTVVLLVTIAFFAIWFTMYPKISPMLKLTEVEVDVTQDIPATWNLDWQGGPGYDRYKILTEKGPYNM